MNPKSILLLYEGETEEEFYRRIINLKVPPRTIRISYSNLKGITTNINYKVLRKIYKHLSTNEGEDQIYVFVAVDREGDRSNDSPMDIGRLKKELSKDTVRVVDVIEVIATQDIECWFLLDIDNIFNYLRVPQNKRNPEKYSNTEAFNNRDLSNLFRQYNKVYLKGRRVDNLLDNLDLHRIYNSCQDLRDGINEMLKLI
ncbi:MAG TPA: DUF4276 family protein [Bacteroidales bacterium]|nr:DUF4276 family protein [Bacteroidales bacterium]